MLIINRCSFTCISNYSNQRFCVFFFYDPANQSTGKEKNSSLRKVVEQQLTRAVWVSVTTNLASVTTKGYLVVTGHYIGSYS